MAYPKAVLAKPVSASLDCTSHDALIIISNDFSHLPHLQLLAARPLSLLTLQWLQ